MVDTPLLILSTSAEYGGFVVTKKFSGVVEVVLVVVRSGLDPPEGVDDVGDNVDDVDDCGCSNSSVGPAVESVSEFTFVDCSLTLRRFLKKFATGWKAPSR